MSWGVSVANAKKDAVAKALEEEAARVLKASSFDEWDEGVEDHQKLAFDAAGKLAEGVPWDAVNVHASGHARQRDDDPSFISLGVSEYVAPPEG